jgi:hypothetical protein
MSFIRKRMFTTIRLDPVLQLFYIWNHILVLMPSCKSPSRFPTDNLNITSYRATVNSSYQLVGHKVIDNNLLKLYCNFFLNTTYLVQQTDSYITKYFSSKLVINEKFDTNIS